MRALTHAAFFGLAALSGLTFALGTAAEAQERRMVIEVKPRSWLDAGKVVPVGSMQNYMNDTTGGDSARFGARNNSNLPDRFSGGRGITVSTPNFSYME